MKKQCIPLIHNLLRHASGLHVCGQKAITNVNLCEDVRMCDLTHAGR